MSREFTDHLENAGMVQHLTVHNSPALNGAAEQANRTHINGACAMIDTAGLPKNLWAEAVHHHVWIWNQVPTHIEKDMQMEDGEVAFPPLPRPAPPMAETIQGPQFQCGANWIPAPVPRGMPATCGSPFRRPMPRHTRLIITSVEELEQHLEVANMPHNELVVTHMCAYV
jgi:hypothetical protein